MGKMRLLAGFWPFRAEDLLRPVHSSGGIVRTVPTLISASMRFFAEAWMEEALQKAQGSALKTGLFVVSRACLRL